MQLAISCEGWFGLGWPQWKRLVRDVEALGFSGLYLSDHIALDPSAPLPSLELTIALAYLADHTERVRFGAMVSPLSLRDPVMLARQAVALDDLSSGRFVLGVGTGWYDREHTAYGYPLGDLRTRFARLEEGLEVLTRLLRAEGPTSYAGRFFQLQDAALPARPQRPGGPPILVGGKGLRRTLPLVARYADIWNANSLPFSDLGERMERLDQLLLAEGRRPEDVRRTMNAPIFCGRTPAELERRVRGVRHFANWDTLPLDQLVEALRTRLSAIVGTPEEVVAQLHARADAGIAELSVQWFDADDIEGIEVLAHEVLPQLAPAAV